MCLCSLLVSNLIVRRGSIDFCLTTLTATFSFSLPSSSFSTSISPSQLQDPHIGNVLSLYSFHSLCYSFYLCIAHCTSPPLLISSFTFVSSFTFNFTLFLSFTHYTLFLFFVTGRLINCTPSEAFCSDLPRLCFCFLISTHFPFVLSFFTGKIIYSTHFMGLVSDSTYLC